MRLLILVLILSAAVFISFILFNRFQNTPDLAAIQKECSKTLRIPPGDYQGLLTDVHIHSPPTHDVKEHILFASKLLQEMNESGVSRVAVQASHMPGGYTPLTRNIDKIWGKISSVCPRIITLLYGFNPDEADSWKYVEDKLLSGNFGGVGEIEFQHGNLDLKHDPESESMQRIYTILEDKGLPLHFQAMLELDPKLVEKISRVVKNHPKLNFIWFGCSGEKQFLELPNLYCNSFYHSQSPIYNQQMLKKSLIGSDAGPAEFAGPAIPFLPYTSFGEAMSQARARLLELPLDVSDKLAHGNFDKIWPKERVK